MTTHRSKRLGRPVGSGAKREAAMQLMREGVPGLEAIARVGYVDPKRIYQKMSVQAQIAEAQGVDPESVLDSIILHGKESDVITACQRKLMLAPPKPRARQFFLPVIDVDHTDDSPPEGARIFVLPKELSAALQEYERLISGERESTDPSDPIRALKRILADLNVKDAELIRAASALLRLHEDERTDDAPHTTFIIPNNGREPISAFQPDDALWIRAISRSGETATQIFFRALEAQRV